MHNKCYIKRENPRHVHTGQEKQCLEQHFQFNDTKFLSDGVGLVWTMVIDCILPFFPSPCYGKKLSRCNCWTEVKNQVSSTEVSLHNYFTNAYI